MSYRLLRNTESRRNRLPQGRVHQVSFQYQIVSSENVHSSSMIQIQQLVFMYEEYIIYNIIKYMLYHILYDMIYM